MPSFSQEKEHTPSFSQYLISYIQIKKNFLKNWIEVRN